MNPMVRYDHQRTELCVTIRSLYARLYFYIFFYKLLPLTTVKKQINKWTFPLTFYGLVSLRP